MTSHHTAEHRILIEREEIRVTEWRLAPNAATGHHRHGFDYLVVPLTEGVLRAVSATGQTETPLQPGSPYFRKAGVEHDVSNGGTAALAFLEIELKNRPG
ncbi:MAG: cupin [Acidibrevibacterium sp.]|uniref:cupin n=1 Tax=Acidibrevibacterium sp. TaxID=2606776 RepID=UPI003CFD5F50